MSTPAQRQEIAQWIVNAEARRDKAGNIKLYKLPPADGGGSFEYAGINDRYHPEVLREIVRFVNAGEHKEAESAAVQHIADYTDIVTKWVKNIGLEAFLRDSAFNRGPKGALRILQLAVGVADDGKYGPLTKAAISEKQKDPAKLLKSLRNARERYERRVAPPVGKRAAFWRGLNARWDNVLKYSLSLL